MPRKSRNSRRRRAPRQNVRHSFCAELGSLSNNVTFNNFGMISNRPWRPVSFHVECQVTGKLSSNTIEAHTIVASVFSANVERVYQTRPRLVGAVPFRFSGRIPSYVDFGMSENGTNVVIQFTAATGATKILAVVNIVVQYMDAFISTPCLDDWQKQADDNEAEARLRNNSDGMASSFHSLSL